MDAARAKVQHHFRQRLCQSRVRYGMDAGGGGGGNAKHDFGVT